MEIAAIGKSETMLGFRLVGIKKTIIVSDELNTPDAEISRLIQDQNLGIIIIDQQSFGRCSEIMQERIRNSVKPAFVVLSTDYANEDLRRMIKKSIGVDLWEQKK